MAPWVVIATLPLAAGCGAEPRWPAKPFVTSDREVAGAPPPGGYSASAASPTIESSPPGAPWTRPSTTASAGHTLTGHFWFYPTFHSAFLPDDRSLFVYLPPGYNRSPGQRYPVLYMQDGQNLFDAATAFGGREWQLDETAQSLILESRIRPLIIVGIANTPARVFEYTWAADPSWGGGGGARYLQMVAGEIKPLIDTTFRTRPDRQDTAIMGSSLGALAAFFVGRQAPGQFSKIGLMSPSIWWDRHEILSEVAGLAPDLSFWLDMGTAEGDGPADYQNNLADARSLAAALVGHGYRLGRTLGYHEAPGADHSELSWSRRVWRPLTFFFGGAGVQAAPGAPVASPDGAG